MNDLDSQTPPCSSTVEVAPPLGFVLPVVSSLRENRQTAQHNRGIKNLQHTM